MRLGNRGEDDLGASLDVELSEGIIQIGEQTEVGVLDGLALTTKDPIGVVDLQILDHSVVVHCKLRSLYVFLYFLAELFKVPVGVKVDFELNLFGAGVSLLVILVLLVLHLIQIVLQVLVLNLHSDKQLDAAAERVVVARHKWWGRVG